MTARELIKTTSMLAVVATVPFLVGQGCPDLLSLIEEPGDTTPISSSVLGVVIPAPTTVQVGILAGGQNIFNAPVAGTAVAVPINQAYDKTITLAAPHRPQDIYSLVWQDGAVNGRRVYMKVVTTDAFTESQHSVSFYFQAWLDTGAVANMWDAADQVAALPGPLAVGNLDLSTPAMDVVVRVGNIALQNNAAVQLTRIQNVEARITGVAAGTGRPYITYMRDVPGRFYALVGSRATVTNPDLVGCPGCSSVQVPGDFFFANPQYASDLTGGPYGGVGGIGDGDNTAGGNPAQPHGEFQYSLLNAAFGAAANRQILLDPSNPGVAPVPPDTTTNPLANPANLGPGSNTVHELAVSCTFLTNP